MSISLANLAKLDAEYAKEMAKAKPVTSGFTDLPAASYNTRIIEADVDESTTGKIILKMKLAVVGGEYDGRYLFKSFVVLGGSAENSSYLKDALNKMGWSVKGVKALAQKARKSTGQLLRVRKSETGNIFINRSLPG